jgi:hypothetical protein
VNWFDAFCHRLAGLPLASNVAEPAPAAESAPPVMAPEERYYRPMPEFIPDTEFYKTREEVADAEDAVIAGLHELVTSWRLSPWQAAFALFNPISEGETDVA